MADVAIYHFSAKTVSRAVGRSSTAAAAYRSGELIVDERTGEVHDYTRRGGVDAGGVILPGGGTMGRSELWNAVEAKHKRGDAVVAREFVVALPHELATQERQTLIASYARELADRYGVAVDYNIHLPKPGELNHHAHILKSACYVSADGSMGKKCVELDPIHCKKAGIENAVETERVRWQERVNAMLESAGHDARIDHRTLEAQGITDRLPGIHMGPSATGIEARGESSEIGNRARAQVQQFMAQVQADAAILKAAEKDLQEMEAELKKLKAEHVEKDPAKQKLAYVEAHLETAKKADGSVFTDQEKAQAMALVRKDLAQPVKPRSVGHVLVELEPMQKQEKLAVEAVAWAEEASKRALPGASIAQAQKAIPGAKKQAEQAEKRLTALEIEAERLAWWRFLRKRQLAKELPKAEAEADRLATRAAALERQAQAPAIEAVRATLTANRLLLADLTEKMAPLQAERKAIEARQARLTVLQASIEVKRVHQGQKLPNPPQNAEKPPPVAEIAQRTMEPDRGQER